MIVKGSIKTEHQRRCAHMKIMTDRRLWKKIYEWMQKRTEKRGKQKLTWIQGNRVK